MSRLGERRGRASRARPPGPLLWLHAASRGEAAAAITLIRLLRAEGARDHFLVSTMTASGAELVASQPDLLHQYLPYDLPRWTARFLDHWRPRAALFLFAEIWPILLRACAQRQIPTLLVNGNVSARSSQAWGMARRIGLRPFACFAHIESPDPLHRARLGRLAARPVPPGGNFKRAAEPLPVDAKLVAALRDGAQGRPILAAAPLHPEELPTLLSALDTLRGEGTAPFLVIAPRHPRRSTEFVACCGDHGRAPGRRSQQDPPAGPTWLLDTMGELGSLYQAADVVCVGGSFVARGGHNPLECLHFDCAALIGPSVYANEGIVRDLERGKALRCISEVSQLPRILRELLDDGVSRRRQADAGRVLAGAWTQETREAARRLLEIIGSAPLRGS